VAELNESFVFAIEKQSKLLGQFGVECVIVGGVAASLYGSAMPTSDIDVCYARDPQNLKRIAAALQFIAVTQIPLVAIAEAGLGQVVPHCRQTALSPAPTQSLCGFATVARNDSSAGRRRRCQGV
jgi:hypothetical protein